MISAVIIAGGRGARLKTLTSNLPKPLVDINGKPFLFYLIRQLEEAGIKKILILSGYLGEEFNKFVDQFKDQFSGIEISVRYSSPNLNTGERLLDSFNELDNRFLFLYGDNYAPINLKKYINKNLNESESVSMLAYENSDGYSKSNILLDDYGKVLSYGSKSDHKHNPKHVDIGYFIMSKKHLQEIKKDHNEHFGRDILKPLIEKQKVIATILLSRYYTVGTIERLQSIRYFFRNTKHILIDRDGVLNVKPPRGTYVENKSQFVWRKGSLEGLKILKENGYKVIVISNQAGIGRGIFSTDALELIHNKMCSDARENSGEIEYIYYCPHHWEDKCDCRKPKPGMLISAQKDLLFDLSKTFFIGDDERDGIAAEAASCKFIKVNEGDRLDDIVKKII